MNKQHISFFCRWVVLCLFLTIQVEKAAAQSEYSFDIFTQEDGLPNNQIQRIFQDSKGWMWIGTSQGLSRFNGYNFVNFSAGDDDSTSIKGSLVRVIKEDSQGNLLVGTEKGGLNIFDRKKETFSQPLQHIPGFQYRELSVNDVLEDEDKRLWLATDFNVFVLDSANSIAPIKPVNSEFSVEGKFIRNLVFDRKNQLWIGSNDGLYMYSRESGRLTYYDLPFGENENREIWEIYLDDEGDIWVGTYSSGLFIIEPETGNYTKVDLLPAASRTETVRAISKGIFGEYWIGTRGGLFKYSKGFGVTGFFRHNLQEPRSLSNNSVLSVFHDAKGETWIGTRGGLNLLAKSKQVFHNFTALPGNSRYLNSSIVYAIWIDDNDNIWLGTEDGGINIYNPRTKTYSYLTADKSQKNSLSKNCIKAFLDDGKGNLWVATYMGGIDVINLKTGAITNYQHNPDSKSSLSDNRVWDLCFDKSGRMWIATTRGIDRFDSATNSFIHYPQLSGNEQIFWIKPDSKGNLWMGSINEIIIFNPEKNATTRYFEHSRTMYEDRLSRIWIATLDKGIALYSLGSGPLKYYGEESGLANNQSLCIQEDDQNNLWVSTSNGLSKFDPDKKVFQNFTSKDGLGNNQFCYGAAYKTESGNLLFGSVSGFNMFNPDEIIAVDVDVPLVFTDLKVFNKSVPVGNSKNDILKKSISETDHLVLNFRQDVFTLEFAALNYVNSQSNLYAYKLEGFYDDWIGPSADRVATFTNLNPGDYTLRVKKVFHESEEDGPELQLGITILPPFWKTNWFIALIVILILTLVYVIVRFFTNREKIKSQLIIERSNARKLHELDMMKLNFFTNISHEIRTPLTLILGPLEKLLRKENIDGEVLENLTLMHRNTRNLNKLVNQLLDFRKLQTGNLKLDLADGDIVSFIRNVVDSFNDYAIEKEIKLTFSTLKDRLFVAFDPDKIEKILNNLLSNAFKFTEAKGAVSVKLSLVFDSEGDDFSEPGEEKQFIEISILDTGKGISNKNTEKIFMRFFQSDDSDKDAGAGIGLALVKELVHLHKGNIFVTSKPGKGTKFTVRIPYKAAIETGSTIKEKTQPEKAAASPDSQEEKISEKIMLIVEDNADVRQFIRSHFDAFFQVVEAVNGEDGWKAALETIPDVIISDIIMPKIDGYELCKRLKNDERTSHIPVLLLTAIHSKENEIRGLITGADDYITKPFDLTVLQAKVENMLSMRDVLKEKYAATMVLEPTNVVLSSPNERFLQKVIDVVEENIADSDLHIEKFATKVGVSRMQLYRKLHALTNMTVKEFIRHIRLKRAVQLLEQEKLNVSEIAYAVGFKDLSHFRKCFKREFGMSATEYLSKKDKK
ncbi:hybrid sensor histidine kinase/response regulator transcription factor [Mariniphaga anaerophila]|uniref:hybrid sensor histidine kinase/response regulator transcription factor n=1 Tax=Mariniphaga anaerophila TaxID=1484053 RepID=UPI0009352072|nr:hybrid sensor histidine kinase/response regulator transcription factor [Mariniphaga anaerophila]